MALNPEKGNCISKPKSNKIVLSPQNPIEPDSVMETSTPSEQALGTKIVHQTDSRPEQSKDFGDYENTSAAGSKFVVLVEPNSDKTELGTGPVKEGGAKRRNKKKRGTRGGARARVEKMRNSVVQHQCNLNKGTEAEGQEGSSEAASKQDLDCVMNNISEPKTVTGLRKNGSEQGELLSKKDIASEAGSKSVGAVEPNSEKNKVGIGPVKEGGAKRRNRKRGTRGGTRARVERKRNSVVQHQCNLNKGTEAEGQKCSSKAASKQNTAGDCVMNNISEPKTATGLHKNGFEQGGLLSKNNTTVNLENQGCISNQNPKEIVPELPPNAIGHHPEIKTSTLSKQDSGTKSIPQTEEQSKNVGGSKDITSEAGSKSGGVVEPKSGTMKTGTRPVEEGVGKTDKRRGGRGGRGQRMKLMKMKAQAMQNGEMVNPCGQTEMPPGIFNHCNNFQAQVAVDLLRAVFEYSANQRPMFRPPTPNLPVAFNEWGHPTFGRNPFAHCEPRYGQSARVWGNVAPGGNPAFGGGASNQNNNSCEPNAETTECGLHYKRNRVKRLRDARRRWNLENKQTAPAVKTQNSVSEATIPEVKPKTLPPEPVKEQVASKELSEKTESSAAVTPFEEASGTTEEPKTLPPSEAVTKCQPIPKLRIVGGRCLPVLAGNTPPLAMPQNEITKQDAATVTPAEEAPNTTEGSDALQLDSINTPSDVDPSENDDPGPPEVFFRDRPIPRKRTPIKEGGHPNVRFVVNQQNPFLLVDTKAALDYVVAELRDEPQIGVWCDVKRAQSKVWFVDISTDDMDFVIDAHALEGELSQLACLFGDPGILKVVHRAEETVYHIQHLLGITVVNVFDLCLWTKKWIKPRRRKIAKVSLETSIMRDSGQKRVLPERHDLATRPVTKTVKRFCLMGSHYLLCMYHKMMDRAPTTKYNKEEFRRECNDPDYIEHAVGLGALRMHHDVRQEACEELNKWRLSQTAAHEEPDDVLRSECLLLLAHLLPQTEPFVLDLTLNSDKVRACIGDVMGILRRARANAEPRRPEAAARSAADDQSRADFEACFGGGPVSGGYAEPSSSSVSEVDQTIEDLEKKLRQLKQQRALLTVVGLE